MHCWDVSLLRTDVCPHQNLYPSGPATLYVDAGHSAESCDDSTHAHSIHHAHTWPETKWTTWRHPEPILRQKSHREPRSLTHWWDRQTARHTEGEPWVWQPATIISSCHYLPSYSQSQSWSQGHGTQSNTRRHTHVHTVQGTHTKTHRRWSWRCRRCIASRCDSLSGCCMCVVNWTDKNKHIACKKKKKKKWYEGDLAMSLFQFESGNRRRRVRLKAVHWVSGTCASAYTWLTRADSRTRSRCRNKDVSTLEHRASDGTW